MKEKYEKFEYIYRTYAINLLKYAFFISLPLPPYAAGWARCDEMEKRCFYFFRKAFFKKKKYKNYVN